MRSIWKGSISFGLVNIPIRLYSAVEQRQVSFHLVHKHDNSPIRYRRFCEKENKEVPWQDISKGIEISKGVLYVMEKDALEKLRPVKSSYIDILEIIDVKQLDPLFFGSHYYMGPDKAGEKSFFLLREVLRQAGKTAVGRFVMREKEYVCAINSYKEGLVLSTLNYSYEVRDIAGIEELKSAPSLRKEEIDLAQQLIEKLYNPEFKLSKYKDHFAEHLKDAIKKREKGIEVAEEEAKPAMSLMDSLKASLKKGEA